MSISHITSGMRYHLWGYLFLIVYGLVLFWPIPFADVTIASGDILQQFYPWTQFWVNEYQTNGYPYWNPYTYGGSPFLGNLQVTPFYPPGFLLPLLSPLKFFGWTLLFHTIFAGIAMYLLIYHLVQDRFSATAMGLVYLSSGFLMTRISDGHITIMNGLPWLPLILLAYLRWSDRQTWGRWTLLVFMIAFQLLGGQPQIPFLTLLFIGLLSLRDSYWNYRKSERSLDVVLRPVGSVILATLLAILLTAPVWLPFLEFNHLSAIRSSGTDFEYASKDSLPLHHLFTLLMPFLYGDPIHTTFWGSDTGYHEICGFLGIGALIFAYIGILSPRFKGKWFWLGCLILFLFLALGANTPLYRWFYLFVPGVQYFRVPARFLLLYSTCVCILGGYGLKTWMWDADKCPHLRKQLIVVLLVLLIVVIFGFVFGPFSFVLQASKVGNQATNVDLEALLPSKQQIRDQWQALWIGLCFVGMWIVGLLLRRPFVQRKQLYSVVFIALFAVELGWFAHRFVNPEKTESILAKEYPNTSTIQYLKQNAGYSRIMLPDVTIGWFHRPDCMELFPNRLMVPRIHTVRGYDQTFLKSYADYIYMMQGISDDRFMNVFLNVFDAARINPKMLSALGVRYVVTPNLEPVRSNLYQEVLQGKERVYEYTRAFSRAYILPSDLSLPDELSRDATAEIILYQPNRVRIRAELNQPGWLVLADNNYPGWEATVQGKPVPIQSILGTFRGIALSSGKHEVEMVYHPIKMKQGISISLATLFLLMAIHVVVFLWRRRTEIGDRKI